MNATFIKWVLNDKIIYVVMRSETPDEWEVEVLNSRHPKIEFYDYWLSRTHYIPATKEEFIEVYNNVNSSLTQIVMKKI